MKIDIDSLIEKYQVDNPVFTVSLPGGEELTFRTFTRKADLDEFLEMVAQWYADVSKEELSSVHPLYGLVPETAQEAVDAYLIHHLSDTPKINLAQALRMLKCPWMVKEIVDSISKESKTMESLALAKAIADSKKNLKPRRSKGTPSSPPSEPSDDIPTS